jgi:hypothetical protein
MKITGEKTWIEDVREKLTRETTEQGEGEREG